MWRPCVVGVAIPCRDCSNRGRACEGHVVLADVQYPTVWLPVGLIAAVVVGAAVWLAGRFARIVVGLTLTALVITGYISFRRSSTSTGWARDAGHAWRHPSLISRQGRGDTSSLRRMDATSASTSASSASEPVLIEP